MLDVSIHVVPVQGGTATQCPYDYCVTAQGFFSADIKVYLCACHSLQCHQSWQVHVLLVNTFLPLAPLLPWYVAIFWAFATLHLLPLLLLCPLWMCISGCLLLCWMHVYLCSYLIFLGLCSLYHCSMTAISLYTIQDPVCTKCDTVLVYVQHDVLQPL